MTISTVKRKGEVVWELSGKSSGLQILHLLPMVKRVEMVCQDSNGKRLELKFAKNQAAEFIRENPDSEAEIKGETLYIYT